MDGLIALILAKKAIGTSMGDIATNLTYRGNVDSIEDLPTAAEDGDMYGVGKDGLYAWNGYTWGGISRSGIDGEPGQSGPPGPKGDPGEDGFRQYTAGDGISIVGNTISLSSNTLRIVGSIDAAVQHTLPDPGNYSNGAEIVVVSNGIISRNVDFELPAGETLSIPVVAHAIDLIAAGYDITIMDGSTSLGILQSCTENSLILDSGTISLPYSNDLTSSSNPSTYDVDVVIGDMFIVLDRTWTYLSNNAYVKSINNKIGEVELNASDVGAIDESSVSHETWVFTLEDDTEVTKEVTLWTGV